MARMGMQFALALLVLVSGSVHADVRPGAVVLPVPHPPVPVPQPPINFTKSAACNRECSNGTLSLTFLQLNLNSPAESTCPAHPDVKLSCGGYACEPNGKMCKASCAGAGDCSAGNMCVSSACVPAQNRCSDDYRSVIGADGVTYSCGNFVCQAGRCLDRCNTSDVCVNGTLCAIETGQCVAPPPPSN